MPPLPTKSLPIPHWSKKYNVTTKIRRLAIIMSLASMCSSSHALGMPWQQIATTAKIVIQRSAKGALYASPVVVNFIFGYLEGKEHAEKEIIETERTDKNQKT